MIIDQLWCRPNAVFDKKTGKMSVGKEIQVVSVSDDYGKETIYIVPEIDSDGDIAPQVYNEDGFRTKFSCTS